MFTLTDEFELNTNKNEYKYLPFMNNTIRFMFFNERISLSKEPLLFETLFFFYKSTLLSDLKKKKIKMQTQIQFHRRS